MGHLVEKLNYCIKMETQIFRQCTFADMYITLFISRFFVKLFCSALYVIINIFLPFLMLVYPKDLSVLRFEVSQNKRKTVHRRGNLRVQFRLFVYDVTKVGKKT